MAKRRSKETGGFEERLEKKRASAASEKKSRYSIVKERLKNLPEWKEFEAARSSSDIKAIINELKKYGRVYRLTEWSDRLWPEITETYILKIDDRTIVSFYIRIRDIDKPGTDKLIFSYHPEYSNTAYEQNQLKSFEELLEFVAEQIANDLPIKVDAQRYAEIRQVNSIDDILRSWSQL